MCPELSVTYVPGKDPYYYGAPERILTSDTQIRNLVLYPTELRAHWSKGILTSVWRLEYA